MRGKFILDASALYPLMLALREELFLYLDRLAILDLTVYEVGNALWRECRKGRIKDPLRAASFFERLLKSVERLRVLDIAGVLRLALDRGLTFYDASYAYVAGREKATLVTEDEELRRACPEALNVAKLVELLKEEPSAVDRDREAMHD